MNFGDPELTSTRARLAAASTYSPLLLRPARAKYRLIRYVELGSAERDLRAALAERPFILAVAVVA